MADYIEDKLVILIVAACQHQRAVYPSIRTHDEADYDSVVQFRGRQIWTRGRKRFGRMRVGTSVGHHGVRNVAESRFLDGWLESAPLPGGQGALG